MKDEIFTDKQTGKNYWMSQIVDMSADLNGFKDTTVKKDNSNHPIKEKPLEVENEYYTEFLNELNQIKDKLEENDYNKYCRFYKKIRKNEVKPTIELIKKNKLNER